MDGGQALKHPRDANGWRKPTQYMGGRPTVPDPPLYRMGRPSAGVLGFAHAATDIYESENPEASGPLTLSAIKPSSPGRALADVVNLSSWTLFVGLTVRLKTLLD